VSYLDYLGIKISESYGMAETSGASFVNTLDKHKVPIIGHSYVNSYLFCFTQTGTCGQALPGMKVKISDDGQILMNGPNVFVGYDQVGCQNFYASNSLTHYIHTKGYRGHHQSPGCWIFLLRRSRRSRS